MNFHTLKPRKSLKPRTVFPVVLLLLSALLSVSCHQARSEEGKPLRIMCVGASITMGQTVNGGYRLPLEKMLEGAGISVEFVGRVESNSKGMTWPKHEGYPGHRIDQIENGATNTFKVTSLPIADGVREHKPGVVLVLCGTNDVRQNYKRDEAPQRLDHLIGTIHDAAPDAQIFVSSIPPDLHFDDAVRRYNAGVAEAVAKRAAAGEKIRFVDNYAAINPATDLQSDRTHPNAAGYLKIARTWFKALAPNAPQIAFALWKEGASEFTGKTCGGYQITMKRNASITDLGVYNAGKPLPDNRAAGIFDAGGQQLATVLVTPTSPSFGLFSYEKLTQPLVLEAGKSYIFASNNVGLPTLVGTDAIVDPLHFDDARFYFDHNVAVAVEDKDGSVLKFPGKEIRDINGAVSYFGPIFRFSS
jgi:lysophospholipase L1-like esterase